MTDLQTATSTATADDQGADGITHVCCHRADHLAFCGVYLGPEVPLVTSAALPICEPCLEASERIQRTNRCPQTNRPCDCPEIT